MVWLHWDNLPSESKSLDTKYGYAYSVYILDICAAWRFRWLHSAQESIPVQVWISWVHSLRHGFAIPSTRLCGHTALGYICTQFTIASDWAWEILHVWRVLSCSSSCRPTSKIAWCAWLEDADATQIHFGLYKRQQLCSTRSHLIQSSCSNWLEEHEASARQLVTPTIIRSQQSFICWTAFMEQIFAR